jgi:6-methylsalicylate decarboxylase
MHYMAVKFLSLARAALTTTAPAWNGRIDTHIHAVPQIYLDAIERAGGDPSGFPVPTWSIDETLLSMDKVRSSIGTQLLLLSCLAFGG